MNIFSSAPGILPGDGDCSFALKFTSTSLKPAFEILSLLLLVRLLPDYCIFLKVPLKSLGKAPDLSSCSISARSPSSFLAEFWPFIMWISEIRSSEGASAPLLRLLISWRLMFKFSRAFAAEFSDPLKLSWESSYAPRPPWIILFFWSRSELSPDGIELRSDLSDSGADSRWPDGFCWFWSNRIWSLFFYPGWLISLTELDFCELFKLGEFSLFSCSWRFWLGYSLARTLSTRRSTCLRAITFALM